MDARLTLGPAWVQLVKPALTRARTVAWPEARGRPARPGLRILFYHRVGRRPATRWRRRPVRFAEHMEAAAARRATGCSTSGGRDLMRGLEPRDDGSSALSFDDGYRDVAYERAPGARAPRLPRDRLRLTGRDRRQARRFSVVRRASRRCSGGARSPPSTARLGAHPSRPHTLTHPDLTALDADAAEREIAGSKAALEARLGRPVRAFCYPAGLYGPRERALVEARRLRARDDVRARSEHASYGPATC